MNKKRKVLAISILACLVVAGCASSPKEVMYDAGKRPATTSIEVFRDGTKPGKTYKEIGELSCEDFGGEDAKVLKMLIENAKKVGANAIIMQPRQDTGYFFNMFGRSGNKYLWKAVAIAYSNP